MMVYSIGLSIFVLVNSNRGEKFWLLRKGNNQSSNLSFNTQWVGIIFTSSNIWILVANILEKVKLYFGFQRKLWRLLPPGSTRPISYPGPFRIILSFLGSPRESSCCYRHPAGTFHHFLPLILLTHLAPKVRGQLVKFRPEAEGRHFSWTQLDALFWLQALANHFFIAMISMELLNNIIIIDLSWPWCPTPIWQNSATCTLRSWTAMLRIGPSISFHHNFQTFRKKMVLFNKEGIFLSTVVPRKNEF